MNKITTLGRREAIYKVAINCLLIKGYMTGISEFMVHVSNVLEN